MTEAERLLETKKSIEAFLRETDRRLSEERISEEERDALLYDRLSGHDPSILLSRLDMKIGEAKKGEKKRTTLKQSAPSIILAVLLLLGLGLASLTATLTPTGLVSLEPLHGTESIAKNFTSNGSISFQKEQLVTVQMSGTIHGKARVLLKLIDGTTKLIAELEGNNDFSETCEETCSFNGSSTRIIVEVQEGGVYIDNIKYERAGISQQHEIPDLNIYGSYKLDLSQYFENSLSYAIETEIPYQENDTEFTLLPNDTGTFEATAYAVGLEGTLTQKFKITVHSAVNSPVVIEQKPPSITYAQLPAVINEPVTWKVHVQSSNANERIFVPIHGKATDVVVTRSDTGQPIKDVLINSTNQTIEGYNNKQAIEDVDAQMLALVNQMKQLGPGQTSDLSDRIQELEQKKKDLASGKARITGRVALSGESNGFLSRIISSFFQKITGNVVGSGIIFHLAKDAYNPGEQITFTIAPNDAEASIYLAGPGYTGYLASRNFSTNSTGEYNAVALITSGTQLSRLELNFRVEHNATSTGSLTEEEAIENHPTIEENITENKTVTTTLPDGPNLGIPLVLSIPSAQSIDISYSTPAPRTTETPTTSGVDIAVETEYTYDNTTFQVTLPTARSVRVKDNSGNNVQVSSTEHDNRTVITWVSEVHNNDYYSIYTSGVSAPLFIEGNTLKATLDGSGSLDITAYPASALIKQVECGNSTLTNNSTNSSHIDNVSCDQTLRILIDSDKPYAVYLEFEGTTATSYSGNIDNAMSLSMRRARDYLLGYTNLDAGTLYALKLANEKMQDPEISAKVNSIAATYHGAYEPFRALFLNETINVSALSASAWNLQYNNNFIPILSCSPGRLDQKVFNRIQTMHENDTYGYDTLHQLLSIIWIKQRNCYDSTTTRIALDEATALVLKLTPPDSDIFMEKQALLQVAGNTLTSKMAEQILSMQASNGAFGTDIVEGGSPHTTALALWALADSRT
ncbi:MAG: hypothetical protein ABIA93_04110 [Candidatus Woesearchaeota archaeon]